MSRSDITVFFLLAVKVGKVKVFGNRWGLMGESFLKLCVVFFLPLDVSMFSPVGS